MRRPHNETSSRLQEGDDEALRTGYLEEAGEYLQQMFFIARLDTEVILGGVFEIYEALVHLLLNVCGRVAPTLRGSRRYDDTIGRHKGEQMLAFWMKG